MIKKFFFFCLFVFLSPLSGEEITVLGIGSPSLDLIQPVDEIFLYRIGLERGGWKQSDAKSFQTIMALATQREQPLSLLGGATCNTMKGLAALGVSTALTGVVGHDSIGQTLLASLRDRGVLPLCQQIELPSTQIACLITPDGERSFCAYNEAERQISPDDLSPELFQKVPLVHIEGYRLINGHYIERAMYFAKAAGATVSFDLCNANFSDRYRQRILGFISTYVDILFLNESEATLLTALSPEKALPYLNHFCNIVVIKLGEAGSLVGTRQTSFHCPAIPTDVVDATGAGDFFAAGFLYGWLQRAPLMTCAKVGTLMAHTVIQYPGRNPQPSLARTEGDDRSSASGKLSWRKHFF